MFIDYTLFNQELSFYNFNSRDVDTIYKDTQYFLSNLPEQEISKFNAFKSSTIFNLTYIEVYQKELYLFEGQAITPYTIQFTRVPDSNWMENKGPFVEQNKKLIDTTTHQYKYSDKYFKDTSCILDKDSNCLKAGLLIYKPGVIVPPHAHLEDAAQGYAYTHTLLHDIEDPYHFWHSYNYMKLNKKGESFYFNVNEVHYCTTKSYAVFLACLGKSK